MTLLTAGSTSALESHPTADGMGPIRSAAFAVILLAEVPAATAGIEPARSPRRLREAAVDAAWIGGAAALDLWSTELVLRNGGRETSPLMRSGLPARVGVKFAVTGIGVAWADHERKRGNRRGAKWIRWGFTGLQLGFAAWNLQQARR